MSRNVFITGVSSGLGWALADYYLKQDDRVFGLSRRTPQHLLEYEQFRFRAIDVANFECLASGLHELFAREESCDLAIFNAGILSTFGDIQQTSLEECRQVMDVNLWSNKVMLDWLLKRFPDLRQAITISSGAAVNGNRGWNAYSISKAALNMLTKLYASEAAATHFVTIAPGLIDTQMQDVLCGLPADDRYPALDALRQRQGTDQMPSGQALAPRLAAIIDAAPVHVSSGEFFDIRKIDWA